MKKILFRKSNVRILTPEGPIITFFTTFVIHTRSENHTIKVTQDCWNIMTDMWEDAGYTVEELEKQTAIQP